MQASRYYSSNALDMGSDYQDSCCEDTSVLEKEIDDIDFNGQLL